MEWLEWSPQQDGLVLLLQLLSDSVSGDNQTQTLVQEKLRSFNNVNDYNNYLIYILTQMPQQDSSTRAIAGLVLKNNVRAHFENIQPAVLEYVKHHSLKAVGDPDAMVRSTVGIVITTIVSRAGLSSWPQVLPRLMELLDSPDPSLVEGAFGALEKICEDSTRELDTEINGVKPSVLMIPKFIEFFGHENVELRSHSLACVSHFVVTHSQALFANTEVYLSSLFKLANDQKPEIRRRVCHAMVMLLEVRPDVLLPHMGNIVEYMLHSTQDKEDTVALEACEFWLSFAEQDELREQLRPYLPRIVPVLLKGMVYDEMDAMTLLGEDEDSTVPDREENIRPRHYHARQHDQNNTEGNTAESGAIKSADGKETMEQGGKKENEESGEGDEDEETDDELDDDIMNEWNLRKCSAAALDVLATVFGDAILEPLLPLLKERLFSQEWMERESGILALGAIADGCMDGMQPHLPTLLPYLLQSLAEGNSLVRSIACWTIGRYSEWLVSTSEPGDREKFFVPVIEGLMRMILDSNKRVQEAGCSAFATLEEEACNELIPFLGPILRNLVFAFEKYQRKNLLILYDAIGTLAESVGSALNTKEYIDMLMPPIIERWQRIPDDDRDLFALLECLSSIAVALGQGFQPFAGPIWERSLRIISQSLNQAQACAQDPTIEPPDKDFLIISLDLLSGLVQGLKGSAENLVVNSQPPILPILGACMRDPSDEVRQSAYALLGDMAIVCYGQLKPHFEQLMPEIVNQIDPNADHVGVCNNASWAAGEIAIRAGPGIQSWINPLLERLVPLLIGNDTPRSLLENSAIAIGRLGLVCPALVAPHLEAFAKPWCIVVKSLRDNNEKESAFSGICHVIQVNPNGMLKCFYEFCEAITQWQSPSNELNEMFAKILHGYKGMLASTWDNLMANFPPALKQRLQERYGV